MAWFMGIDIGSGTSKGIIIRDGEIISSAIFASGVNYQVTAQKLKETILLAAGLHSDDIAGVAVTGHGAKLIPFSNLAISDLQCCARGIHHILPDVRTIIDVQEQTCQIIKLNETGQVTDYAVSDICASSSGHFLIVIANVLQLKLEDIGPLSLKSHHPVNFTTGCAVFGESEAISRVAEGFSKEDILAGVHQALADKIASLLAKVGIEEACAISGGGGLNAGLIKRLENQGTHLLVPPQPQFTNALGAAVIIEERNKRAIR
jgi:(R)-2-hydroxyacyl-CoA dehydratese activating ATPase